MDNWKFEFPVEVQAERQVVLTAIDHAMIVATPEAVREAGKLAWAWIARYPEDYAVWDAGEPLALLADAMETTSSPEPEVAAALSR